VAAYTHLPNDRNRGLVSARQRWLTLRPERSQPFRGGRRVPAFTKYEDVAHWLDGKPRDVGVVFAARAALRVILVFASIFLPHGGELDKAQRHAILQAFRCAAAAWAVAAYPGHAADLVAAAAAASSHVDKTAPNVVTAASFASAAAGAFEFGGLATTSSKYAVEIAASADRRTFEDMLKAFAADAEILDQGYSPVTLALSSTLWPGMPDRMFEAWADLERALLDANEDWEVWTDWYEARLKAGEADQVLEVARATISDDVWAQGPKVVNGHIRDWLEERGIWRHATGDEAQPADVVPEVPAADGGNDLERRLAALSRAELAVIGARVAMRAVPLLTLSPRSFDDPAFAAATLSMFGAAAAAWFAAVYPGHPASSAPSRAPLDALPQGRYEADLGIITAGQGISASFAFLNGSADMIVRSLDAICGLSDGKQSGAVFQMATSNDLRDLDGASAAEIARLPLWSGGALPAWMAQRWGRLKSGLILTGIGWEVWAQWYEDRVVGNVRSDNHEFVYVEVPEQFWRDGPARVNTWILKRLDELERLETSRGEQPAESASVSPEQSSELPDVDAIPPQATAATQFTHSADGRVDLARDPPSHAPLVDAIQHEHYEEVRHKALELAKLGHNQLGDLVVSVDRFLAAVPERLEDVSIGRLWSRGNTLRRRLKASDAASSDPTDPARLMPLATENLRDLVETYNIFIIGDPKGRELDQVRLGPQERDAAKSVLDAAAPIIGAILASEGVVTPAAKEALAEQFEVVGGAATGIDVDQANAQAGKASGNIVVEMLRLAYAPVRRAIATGKKEAGFAWKEVRAGVYRYTGPAIVVGGITYRQEVIEFVVNNAATLKAFVTQAFENPALIKIIDAIAQSATLGL